MPELLDTVRPCRARGRAQDLPTVIACSVVTVTVAAAGVGRENYPADVDMQEFPSRPRSCPGAVVLPPAGPRCSCAGFAVVAAAGGRRAGRREDGPDRHRGRRAGSRVPSARADAFAWTLTADRVTPEAPLEILGMRNPRAGASAGNHSTCRRSLITSTGTPAASSEQCCGVGDVFVAQWVKFHCGDVGGGGRSVRSVARAGAA